MVAISLAPPALLWSELDPNERLFPAERVATAAAVAKWVQKPSWAVPTEMVGQGRGWQSQQDDGAVVVAAAAVVAATAAAEAEVEVKAEVEVAAALIFWYVRPVQQPLPLF